MIAIVALCITLSAMFAAWSFGHFVGALALFTQDNIEESNWYARLAFALAVAVLIYPMAWLTAMSAWNGPNLDLDADRACRPGMLVERLDDIRALCIGGREELWIVNYGE